MLGEHDLAGDGIDVVDGAAGGHRVSVHALPEGLNGVDDVEAPDLAGDGVVENVDESCFLPADLEMVEHLDGPDQVRLGST